MTPPEGSRRLTLVALAVTALFVAPLAVTAHEQDPLALADAPGVHEPHASILIDGDAAFAGPLSGVRGGSGTAEDPYRISGWTIARNEAYGIHLKDTTAHVVIERVDFGMPHSGAAAHVVACELEGAGCGFAAIRLTRAENVTIRDVVVETGTFNVHGTDVAHVVIERVTYTPALAVAYTPTPLIRFTGGHNVTLRDSVIVHGGETVHVEGVSDVVITNASFSGRPVSYLFFVGPGTDFTLRENRFDGAVVLAGGDATRVRVIGNTWTWHGFLGVTSGDDTWTRSVLVCGNTFAPSEYEYGVYLRGIGGARVVGNSFGAWTLGADVARVDGLEYERNHHDSWHALNLGSDGRVKHNAFEWGGVGTSEPVDLTLNWWGAEDGPSGEGPGSGAPVHSLGGVTWDPWLTSAPDTNVDCDALDVPAPRPPPPRQRSTVTVPGATAWRVDVNASGNDQVTVFVEHALEGHALATFVGGSLPGDPTTVWHEWALHRYSAGGARIVLSDPDVRVPDPVLRANWGSVEAWSCTGNRCPPFAVGAVVSTDGEGPSTIHVVTTGNATASLVTGPVRLLSTHEPDEGDALTVDGMHASAVVTRGAVSAFHAEHALWGFALQGAAQVDDETFRLERPDGTAEEITDEVTFYGDAPGAYAFRSDGVRAGSFVPAGYALVMDVPGAEGAP